MVRFFAAVLAVLPAMAWAEAEQEQIQRQAFEEFEQARRLFDAEDYLSAARHFEEAFRLVPSASVHYNIARSYELAGEDELAAQHYRAFLDARAGNPARRRYVQERMDGLLGTLRWVDVTTVPEGATLFIDGRERGIAPASLALSRARHTLEARWGDIVVSRNLDTGSELLRVTMTQEQRQRVAVGEEPGRQTEVTPGTVVTHSESLEPPADQVVQTSQPPVRRQRRLHPAYFFTSLGLTLAAGVALAVTGTKLFDQKAEYDALPEGDPRLPEMQSEGETLEGATTGLWVVTAFLGAATVAFAIFTDWGSLKRRRRAGRVDVSLFFSLPSAACWAVAF